MKKISFIFLLLTSVFAVKSQTVITYENHGIFPDTRNVMKLASYLSPGESGRNVIWDFSLLQLTGNFEGVSDYSENQNQSSVFNMANVAVEEFGNYFFFRVNEEGIEQYGFLSSDKQTMIIYNEPFIKIKYPFAFGDNFEGNYGGSISSGCSNGSIDGTYRIEADGLGTLLLPGNVTYDNALRIKETKAFKQRVNDSTTDTRIVTYRWYVNENRYPVLTLISKEMNYASGAKGNTTQAAFNPEMVLRPGSSLAANSSGPALGFEVFPNPSTDKFNISFNLPGAADVNLSVFHMNGSVIRQIAEARLQEGKHSYSFSAREWNLPRGAYLLRLNVDGLEITSKIVRQ